MDLNTFRNWAIGQGQVSNPTADPNNAFPGQCVSLIQQYLNRVYGIAWTPRGHAKDWATNGNVLSYFDRVGSPQAGDIGISGATASNPYGHIWIYTSPTTILEQNGRVSRRVSTGAAYANPIAILRRKGTPQQGGNNMIPNGENEFNRWNDLHHRLRGRYSDRATFQNVAVGKTWLSQIELLSDDPEANGWFQDAVVGQVAVRDKWDQQIYGLQDQLKKASDLATQLQAQLAKNDADTKALNKKVEDLNKKVSELQSPDNIVVTRTGFSKLFDTISGFFKKNN